MDAIWGGNASDQQYCEAELVGNLVIVVGDWYRNSNPAQLPTGRVRYTILVMAVGTTVPQCHHHTKGDWEQWLANGYLYYAGGVRSPSANDATNKTFRYDPVSDQWTRWQT